MNHLLIYTEQTSNRLSYTFDLLITDLLGLQYELTSDKILFSDYPGTKFSYASQPVSDEIFFAAKPLLFATDIELQPVGIYEYKRIRGFYSTASPSILPFDIFASTFFMVSRYEEYLPAKTDKHGRYRASQSLNKQGGFLEKPMVNYYALELKAILQAKFPGLIFKQHKFEYLPTFDIDMAYCYLEKGFKRNLGGTIRSFILSDLAAIKERFRVLLGKQDDPFDAFGYIEKVCNEFSVSPFFFFLLGDGSQFDKNIPHTNKQFRSLIKRLSEKYRTAIHLSYASHTSRGLPTEEIAQLEEITGKKIYQNRFHYLKFHLPHSYQRLLKYGITEDYSMGYAPRIGFRAGICTPFSFFDLETNKVTALKVVPFAFMDTTFTEYKRARPKEALEQIRTIMHHVQETGGQFVGLWHNSSFAEKGEWEGWRNVFETVTREASEIMNRQ
jgi:hypothetical protein